MAEERTILSKSNYMVSECQVSNQNEKSLFKETQGFLKGQQL